MSKHTKETQIQLTERQNGSPSMTATETETHVFSVLPSAAEFASFEAAVPGTGERILTLFEKQFEHRCNLEIAEQERQAKQQENDNNLRTMGIVVGLLVV